MFNNTTVALFSTSLINKFSFYIVTELERGNDNNNSIKTHCFVDLNQNIFELFAYCLFEVLVYVAIEIN